MERTFIKSIEIKKVRHLSGITIPLSESEPKHLILTGKNGSGKTSVLEALAKYIDDNGNPNKEIPLGDNNGLVIRTVSTLLRNSNDGLVAACDYKALDEKYLAGKFILAFYRADRESDPEKPDGITKITPKEVYNIKDDPGKEFIKYMVGLKATAAFAKESEKTDRVEEIGNWFARFEKILQRIYDDPELKLEFNIESFEFTIRTGEHEPFTFNQMSRGYSAIFSIINDLLMRTERHGQDVEGIVLIDEIETHLHLELQRVILPILTGLFPRVQFVVATHSPFILSSLPDAVIFDLDNQQSVVMPREVENNT